MDNIFNRMMVNLKRRIRARRMGVPFRTRAGFKMPKSLFINGQKLLLNLPQDEAFESEVTEIFLDDDYRLEKLSTSSIKTILDIGGNIGLFCLAAKMFFPQAVMHVYEPNPGLMDYLKYNTEPLGIHCYAEAVGSESGRVSLIVSDKGSGVTRIKLDQGGAIPQIAFREAIRRMGGHVDLLKVDCEGAEWDLFKDAEAWKGVNFLTMEYHLWPGKPTAEDVKLKVRELGFRIVKMKPLSGWTGMLLASRA